MFNKKIHSFNFLSFTIQGCRPGNLYDYVATFNLLMKMNQTFIVVFASIKKIVTFVRTLTGSILSRLELKNNNLHKQRINDKRPGK